MAIRINAVTLLSSTALAGEKRVAAHVLVTAVPLFDYKRVDAHAVVDAAAYGGEKRVDGHYIVSAISIHNAFFPNLLSSGQIFDIESWTLDLVSGRIPEINPYKPQVPESLIALGGPDSGAGREIFDWLEEQQKTIRLQHNITQAGDTTFPHEMIINTHTDKQFKLGSIGKFYHEDHGVMLARYVKFDEMDESITAFSPAGLIKKGPKLEWIVTNRYDLSDPYLCVGVIGSYTTPKSGSYGWVIIDGTNLQAMVTEGTNRDTGVGYVWSASGKVSPAGQGIIICRRVHQDGDITLLRGYAHIRLESMSIDGVKAGLADLIAQVEQLVADVELLKQFVDEDALAAITSSIEQLRRRLVIEENTRRSADAALNTRIDNLDFVTDGELTSAITALQNQINALENALTIRIDSIEAIAQEALAKANEALSINIGAIQGQLNAILAWIDFETGRAKGKFPVVDGSVPPNLVYADDGSLIYVETF